MLPMLPNVIVEGNLSSYSEEEQYQIMQQSIQRPGILSQNEDFFVQQMNADIAAASGIYRYAIVDAANQICNNIIIVQA